MIKKNYFIKKFWIFFYKKIICGFFLIHFYWEAFDFDVLLQSIDIDIHFLIYLFWNVSGSWWYSISFFAAFSVICHRKALNFSNFCISKSFSLRISLASFSSSQTKKVVKVWTGNSFWKNSIPRYFNLWRFEVDKIFGSLVVIGLCSWGVLLNDDVLLPITFVTFVTFVAWVDDERWFQLMDVVITITWFHCVWVRNEFFSFFFLFFLFLNLRVVLSSGSRMNYSSSKSVGFSLSLWGRHLCSGISNLSESGASSKISPSIAK